MSRLICATTETEASFEFARGPEVESGFVKLSLPPGSTWLNKRAGRCSSAPNVELYRVPNWRSVLAAWLGIGQSEWVEWNRPNVEVISVDRDGDETLIELRLPRDLSPTLFPSSLL